MCVLRGWGEIESVCLCLCQSTTQYIRNKELGWIRILMITHLVAVTAGCATVILAVALASIALASSLSLINRAITRQPLYKKEGKGED